MALYLAITLDSVVTRADYLVSHNFGICLFVDLSTSLSASSCSSAGRYTASPTTILEISFRSRYLCKIPFRLGLAPRNEVNVPKNPNKFLISGIFPQVEDITKFKLWARQ